MAMMTPTDTVDCAERELCLMALRKLSLVVFVVLFASYHPSAAVKRVNDTVLMLRKYKGCYFPQFTGSGRVKDLNGQITLHKCLQLCKEYSYYGMEEGRTCHCEKKLDIYSRVEEDECDRLCPNGYPCGGSIFVSFYESRYVIQVGCFEKVAFESKINIPGVRDLDICLNVCQEIKKYSAFAVSY
ncbi:hypothetical protein HELRODRAFT_177703 [Helobdella robusta]|uniref:WSC domain-containing protein n=1 Tax=Helobdella robusta TaxID=6412 RepID=T1FC39_HELRO|nr:hypothetical protein HELRODRAFT_177703 [Helobdella robusta]ESN97648.1 hypothetical protein HELRODRAFT_177703 [Helobdella robusta]